MGSNGEDTQDGVDKGINETEAKFVKSAEELEKAEKTAILVAEADRQRSDTLLRDQEARRRAAHDRAEVAVVEKIDADTSEVEVVTDEEGNPRVEKLDRLEVDAAKNAEIARQNAAASEVTNAAAALEEESATQAESAEWAKDRADHQRRDIEAAKAKVGRTIATAQSVFGNRYR